MSEAVVLVRKGDKDQSPVLYACPKCGRVHSPSIYLCKSEDAHKAARSAAEDCYECREHNHCNECGAECPKSWLRCGDCRKRKAFNEAEKVDQTEVDECFGYDGEFYTSIEEAIEAGEPWVFDAIFIPFRLNADYAIEAMLDEHHEDASLGDLKELDALYAAIEAFNKSQTSGSFYENRERIAILKHQDGEEAA